MGCRDEKRHSLGAKSAQSAKQIKATRTKLSGIRALLGQKGFLTETDRDQLAAAVREDDFVNAVLALLLTSIAHEAGQFSLEEAKDLHRYRLAREQGVRALIVGRGAESLLIEGRHADAAAYESLKQLVKAGADSAEYSDRERQYLKQKVESGGKGEAILATEFILAKKRGQGDSFAILTLDKIIREQTGGIKEFAILARSVIADR